MANCILAVRCEHKNQITHLMALCLMVVFSVIVPVTCFAQRDPLSGVNRFPEFRNLSGLAGGGYGVDADGRLSLFGPTALSTPVAHVLGHNHLFLLAEKASLRSSPRLSGGDTNGTLAATYGCTFGRINFAATDMVISASGNQAFNLQAEYIPASNSPLVGSIGVQDIFGGGGSSGRDLPGDRRTSRSFFGVATYRIDTKASPFYVSAGIGTRRFAKGFLSASYQVCKPLRLYAEHDGFGPNYGALIAWNTSRLYPMSQLAIRIGMVQYRYPTLGASLGF
jgi:hypothetical protein